MDDTGSATAAPIDHVAVVVVDVVESVVVMQKDFREFIARWQQLVGRIRSEVLQEPGDQLVKSLGDGLLLTFPGIRRAIVATMAIQRLIPDINQGVPPDRRIALRLAIHDADIVRDDLDIYGPGVNLAARLATLARPNEIVISDIARDAIDDPFVARFEDLGPCFLKHIEQPVRAFVVRPADAAAVLVAPLPTAAAVKSTLAVLDFAIQGSAPEHGTWGVLLADELARMVSRQTICGVMSRLSTRAVAASDGDLDRLAQRLSASYLVTGAGTGDDLCVDLRYGVWVRGTGWVHESGFRVTRGDLGDPDSTVLNQWVADVSRLVAGIEIRRAQGLELNALADYTLLVSGVSLMHKTSAELVERAGEALTALTERHPRVAEPRAWLAKSHVLRVANGVAGDPALESQRAHAHIRRALDAEPRHALATCVDGLVHLFLDRDIEAARACYEKAIDINRNESLAWLFLSSVHAHAGDGAKAVECVSEARRLSPVDPLAHYFDGFTAWSMLAAQRYDEACQFARRAMALNRSHRPTYFTLTMAQQLCGDTVAARRTAEAALALVPNFSVRNYLKGFPGGANAHAEKLASALRQAGLPE